MMPVGSTGTEQNGQGKAVLTLTFPCGKGQSASVLALCPGTQAEPLGAGCSWRNSTIYLQRERRGDKVASGAAGLCPSAGLEIPPRSSSSAVLSQTGTFLTARASCSLRVTPGACSKVRAGFAGAGRGEAPGWGFISGLGLSFPGRLCPSAPMHGQEDTHPRGPTGLSHSPHFPITGSDRLQPLGHQRSQEGVGPTAPRGRRPGQSQLCSRG